jgi:hypothetical protein
LHPMNPAPPVTIAFMSAPTLLEALYVRTCASSRSTTLSTRTQVN